MIDINYEGKLYHIKNTTKDYTVGEFEELCHILNTDMYKYDKYVKILLISGVSQEIIDNLDVDELLLLVKEFNFNYKQGKIIKEFKINGIKYTCYDKSFKLTVKNMLLIETYMTLNPQKYFGEVLAILYTNKDCVLSLTDKAKLIRETIPAEIVIPIIYEVTANIIDNLNLILNDNITDQLGTSEL